MGVFPLQGHYDPSLSQSLSKPLAQNRSVSGPAPSEEGGIEKAAKSFEAFFVQMLLSEMRKTIPKGGFLDGGLGKDVYNWMFDEAISKAVTQNGGMGLAKLLIETYGDRNGP